MATHELHPKSPGQIPEAVSDPYPYEEPAELVLRVIDCYLVGKGPQSILIMDFLDQGNVVASTSVSTAADMNLAANLTLTDIEEIYGDNYNITLDVPSFFEAQEKLTEMARQANS